MSNGFINAQSHRVKYLKNLDSGDLVSLGKTPAVIGINSNSKTGHYRTASI